MLDRIVANYRLGRRLGVGGMGEVFLATDTRLDCPVALRLMTEEAEETDPLSPILRASCELCVSVVLSNHDPDRAIEESRRAMVTFPDFPPLWSVPGTAQLEKAKYSEVLETFTRAYTLNNSGPN